MLTFETAKPDLLLRPFIHCYAQRDFVPDKIALQDHSLQDVFIEPVLPRTGAMLEFNFAAIYDVQPYGTTLLRPSWAATIVGPIEAHRVRLVLRDRVQSLTILFRPMGLNRLFGVPVAPLTGVGAEGHAVCGQPISSLHQHLGNLTSLAQRARVLDAFLLGQLRSRPRLHPSARALNLLASGQSTVLAAAGLAGVGERQLERRSLELTGLSPKLLARIARFQRAIDRRKTSRTSWLEIAHEVGYYDQMHMVRDFHDLGGGPPTAVSDAIGDSHLISFTLNR